MKFAELALVVCRCRSLALALTVLFALAGTSQAQYPWMPQRPDPEAPYRPPTYQPGSPFDPPGQNRPFLYQPGGFPGTGRPGIPGQPQLRPTVTGLSGHGQPRRDEDDRKALVAAARHGGEAAFHRLSHVRSPASGLPSPKPTTVPKPNSGWGRGWLYGIGAAVAAAFGSLFRRRKKD